MPKRGGKGPIKTIARGMGKANNALGQITAVLDQQSQALQQIQAAGSDDNRSNQSDAKVLMSIKIQQAQLELQKDQVAFLKKISDSQNKQIEALQKGNKDWKSVGDKFKDMKRNLQDALDPNTIKKAMLGPFSMFKGVRDKQADYDYVKRMKALGSGKSDKDLMADSKAQRNANRTALRAQDDIDRLKKMGATDDQIKNSDAMKKRNAALNTSNSYNQVSSDGKSAKDANNPMGGNVAAKSASLVQLPSDKGQVSQSTTDLLAEQQAQHENQMEALRLQASSADLLQQIASNTAIMAGKRSSSAGGAEDAGGAAPNVGGARQLGGLSAAFKGIGDSMGSMGAGIGKGVGSLIGGVFSGIMQGIADGIASFGTMKAVKGIGALGLLTGVMWGFTQVLQSFQDMDWDSIGKGLLMIGATVVAAGLMGKFADKIALGSLALAGLGAALWVVGQAFQAVGEAFNMFVDGIDRLSNIGFDNLLGVAGGLTAISAAMAAFGAGQAAAGLGTLVGNLLTIGQDSPLQQLQKLADMGTSLNDAAKGIDSIGQAMIGFSKVDKNAIQSLNDFPWLRATAFVAAGGAMSVAGGSVYNTSKSNADEQAKVDGKKSGGIVNAPTSNVSNNNQTNVIKPPVRNSESSYNKYLSRRFA